MTFPARLLLLPGVLAATACSDEPFPDEPFAPGTTFQLDAVVRAMHDCSFGGDASSPCGERQDTVEGARWNISGTFSVIEAGTGETRLGFPLLIYVAEGEVDMLACDPDCEQMPPGTVMLVDVTRFSAVCGDPFAPVVSVGPGGHAICQGRNGERMNVISVSFRESPAVTLVAEDLGVDGGTGANYADRFGPIEIAPIRGWLEVEWSLGPAGFVR
jgi:hypothetical protein